MNKNIAVIRGDGIGPEIVGQAIRVLDKIAEKYGHTFTYTEVDMAAAPLTNGASLCLRPSWTSAWPATVCCSAPWAAPSGKVWRVPSARNAAC